MAKLYPATYEPGGEFGLGRVVDGPVERGEITLLFGTVDALHPGGGHAGVDFGWWTDNRDPGSMDGEPIINKLAGTVIDKGGPDSVMGYYTMIAHGDLAVPGTIATLYLHSPGPSPFNIGDEVPVGATINVIDNTGLSTGPHLHWGMYQVQPDGHLALVNPLDHLGYEEPEADSTYHDGDLKPAVVEGSVPVLPRSEENEVQVVRTMDIATADIALALAKQEEHAGVSTVSLLSDGDLGHVVVGISIPTAAFMEAYPGFQR